MAGGDITKSTALLAEQYDKHATALKAAGISQQQYADIITKNIPLTDAQKEAMAENNDVFGTQSNLIDENRTVWETANAELVKSQTAQFNMATAIGATSDQLLGMAKGALPPVQAQILAYVANVNGIPPAKFTEVTTDADPNDVAQVQAILDDMAKDRDSTVNVDADTSNAESAIRGLMNKMANSVFFLHPSVAAPSASAAGQSAVPAGFPMPTAGPSARGRAAPPSSGTVVNNYVAVSVPVGVPTAEVGRYVADALAAYERRNGSRRRVA
jgi:hypothetical protein